jgi:hypothetical protein
MPNIKPISSAMKEAWIDLECLSQSATIENGFAVLYWEYCNRDGSIDPEDHTLRYKLRVALRAVGHKITKYITTYNDDGKLTFLEVVTSITEDEYMEAGRLYNKWVGETQEEEYVHDSESECECEHENPSN